MEPVEIPLLNGPTHSCYVQIEGRLRDTGDMGPVDSEKYSHPCAGTLRESRGQELHLQLFRHVGFLWRVHGVLIFLGLLWEMFRQLQTQIVFPDPWRLR